jgi:hypothetical protein
MDHPSLVKLNIGSKVCRPYCVGAVGGTALRS